MNIVFKKFIYSILLLFSILLFSQNKENSTPKGGKRSFNGSPVGGTIKPKNTGDCPIKVPVNPAGYEVFTPVQVELKAKANLIRSTQTLKFNLVNVNDIQLNIPAFKQFKNNRTDFTEDGETAFKEIIEKVKLFLGTDNKNKPISLKITGSASQIPTSFDANLPNNNLNPDGSSISGKTSIENNKKLAKARADELAKKLRHFFPTLTITTPNLNEIKLGVEKWDYSHQKLLAEAIKKKDRVAMDKVFEPFQKDQWVMLQSADRTTATIQPEAVKMYMVSTTPPLKSKIDNKEELIKTIFIVSKSTYDKVGPTKIFGSVVERDKFLRKMSLKIFQFDKDSVSRWYLLSGKDEINAFNLKDYKEKTWKMHKLGINDLADQAMIDRMISEEIIDKYK
ncbi:MAG: hypothetical protein EAZ27_12565 [Cytophagales bacterium]|nr:MAG: hypothetical protein EAZ27_12565 [Cytophagales bacterium]